jgi:hypothetical protein
MCVAVANATRFFPLYYLLPERPIAASRLKVILNILKKAIIKSKKVIA